MRSFTDPSKYSEVFLSSQQKHRKSAPGAEKAWNKLLETNNILPKEAIY
jgi:hypothetical protein